MYALRVEAQRKRFQLWSLEVDELFQMFWSKERSNVQNNRPQVREASDEVDEDVRVGPVRCRMKWKRMSSPASIMTQDRESERIRRNGCLRTSTRDQ